MERFPHLSVTGGTARTAKPCHHWWGNSCSGFGTSTDCLGCGWPKESHPEEMERLERIIGKLFSRPRAGPALQTQTGPDA